ncbi:NAD(P)-dependent oxidoreductase [Flavobacterium sp. HJSW_4]|uniref:NAD(P)-dependent oxidoreductase n=1 Tax=Flavobacterium sp. HJSW_4 TaxID=3344660 RepID=UPI0035F3FE1E
MKIAVIGTTGFVGTNITNELINRKHSVTGISRNVKTVDNPNLITVSADVTEVNKLAEILKGSDIVVSAFNAGWENPNMYDDYLAGSKAIHEAVKLAGAKRYIVIGGAGSLYVAEGVQAVDTPEVPEEFRAGAKASRDYLNILKNETDLDWAFFCPPFEMHPHVKTGRTGKYRIGTDFPVFNDEKISMLSVEDLAVVIADEIENQKHSKQQFTAAY